MQTLSGRVKARVEHADEDVQFLFEHLKKYPNMPVTVYSVATTAIMASLTKLKVGLRSFAKSKP